MQEDVCAAVKELELKTHWGNTYPDKYSMRFITQLSFRQKEHTEMYNRKDTVGLHVTMNDVLCMQITKNEKKNIRWHFQVSLSGNIYTHTHIHIIEDLLHALSCLPGNVYELDYLEVCLQDMNVFVKAAALTPLGHNGQVVLRHVAHEQQDVDMSRFPVSRGKGEEEITKTTIR